MFIGEAIFAGVKTMVISYKGGDLFLTKMNKKVQAYLKYMK